MKTSSPRIWLSAGIGLVLTVAVVLVIILAVRHRAAFARQQEIGVIGVDWQRRGLLSQSDYVELRRIIDEAQAHGTIPDHDLDWSLATMKRAPDAIVHTRVMGLLELLARNSQTSVSQKNKIAAAIIPYLESKNQLDRLASGRVQRTLQQKPALQHGSSHP